MRWWTLAILRLVSRFSLFFRYFWEKKPPLFSGTRFQLRLFLRRFDVSAQVTAQIDADVAGIEKVDLSCSKLANLFDSRTNTEPVIALGPSTTETTKMYFTMLENSWKWYFHFCRNRRALFHSNNDSNNCINNFTTIDQYCCQRPTHRRRRSMRSLRSCGYAFAMKV